MLLQEQSQNHILSQKMLSNLSVLQMNRVALNIMVDRLSKKNPLIRIDKNTTPWMPFLNKNSTNIFDDTLTDEKKLFDFLREELFVYLKEEEYPIMYLIIGNLDSKGFLLYSLDTLCKGTDFPLDRLVHIQNILMNSSYLGLAASDSKEYLLFVSQKLFGNFSLEYKIANIIVQQTSNMKINLKKIIKLLNIPEEEVVQALQHIKKIPSGPLGEKEKKIYPDFIVTVGIDQTVSVVASTYLTPTISIKENLESTYTKSELKDFLKEAKILQDALNKREQTLRQCAEALIISRSDFFVDDFEINAEVQLKDIAQLTGRHISTVSRALKDRYFLFENQIYPFSVLFNHQVGNSNSYLIKKIIKDLIKNENTDTPISDTLITNILHKKGIKISRRTVNKYRNSLQIYSSYQR